MQKGSLNKVMLIGHLGADAESRFTQSGVAVATFRMATNESWKNNDGSYEDKSEWHRVVVFGKAAETANQFLKKGQLVFVEGRLRSRSWDDKDGVSHSATEVIADRFTMLGRKGDQSPAAAVSDDENGEDDLPF